MKLFVLLDADAKGEIETEDFFVYKNFAYLHAWIH